MCKALSENPLYHAPSEPAVLIIHQQTHPIAFAELAYRAAANASARSAVLDKYWERVSASADFMVSFANESYGYDRRLHRNDSASCLSLGPPLFPGMGIEGSDPGNNGHTHPRSPCVRDCYNHTWNSMYELVQWRWGLETAQAWRQRQGLSRDAGWDTILRTLCTPKQRYLPNGSQSQPVYFFDDGSQGLGLRRPNLAYTLGNLYACSYLPCETHGVDKNVMNRTLWLDQTYDYSEAYPSDIAMYAMTAARLGNAQLAVDLLLLDNPSNRYNEITGQSQARGGVGTHWPAFTPSNAQSLMAIAFLVGGWDGDGGVRAPGLPRDWQTKVKAEGFAKCF